MNDELRFLLNDDINDDEIKSYILFHDQLNPKLWENKKLKLEVLIRLLRIAIQFYKFLDIPKLVINDIIFVGSNASFNYTSLSDIDVHLITDYDKIGHLAENIFSTKKALWASIHNINIKGFNVELYVEDIKNPPKTNGAYSLLKRKWIKEPVASKPSWNDRAVIAKTNDIANEIDLVLSDSPTNDEINLLKEKIRNLRKAGLDTAGEWSTENLVFKSLRNLGYLEKLWNTTVENQDKSLSLENFKKNYKKL